MNKWTRYLLRIGIATLCLALVVNIFKVNTYAATDNTQNTLSTDVVKSKNSTKENATLDTNTKTDKVVKSDAKAVNITAELTDEDKAVQKINDGTEDLSDYTLLKIRKVKTDNLTIIQKSIQNAKNKKGSNLTKDEISNTVTESLNSITAALDSINQGQATVGQYKLLEVTVVNDVNLKDINDWLKGQGYTNINTLKDAINKIVQAMKNINNGVETADDYKTLKINNVEADYVPLIRKDIASAKAQKAAELTKSEISDVAVKVVSKINTILDSISQGKATVEDYAYIGVVNVNNINLQDINVWMNGKKWTKLTDEIAIINTILEPLRKINAGIEVANDYEILGIDGVNQSNLESVRASIAEKKQLKGADLTKAEIAETVDESVRLLDFFYAINSGTATLDDYDYIGVTGVNSSNLKDINQELKGKNYKTVKKVQDNIDAFNSAIKNINQGTDKVSDYETLKVQGVTETNIEFIRSDIKVSRDSKGSDLTKVEIQESVTVSLSKIKAIEAVNNGVATLDDYNLLKVTGVTSANISFINAQIKGGNFKTIADIQVKVTNLVAIYEAYVKINLGQGTLDDYKLIGAVISRVDFLNYVNIELTGKGYFTLAEVQAKIDVVIKVRVAIENINKGVATVEDYLAIGAVGVTVDNLVYVNAELKGKNLQTLVEIQAKIDVVVKVSAVIGRINAGTATVDDYIAIGIKIVNNVNISYVNGQLAGKNYLTVDEIKVAVETAIKIKGTFEKINLGQATVVDYQYVGITGVTIQNLAYVNAQVRGKNFLTVDVLQARVNIVVDIYESILKINKIYGNINLGQGTLDDYAYIGVVGVTVDNLVYINADLKGKGYLTSTDIQIRVTVLVDVYNAFVRINSGNATLDDYKLIGATGITVDNLAYINLNIKGGSYFALGDLQVKLDVLVKVYNAYVNINAGKATVDDYITVGVTGVTVDNLVYVNLNVKGGNYFVLADVQAKVDVVVKMYNAFVRINAGQGTIEDYNTIGITGITVDNLAYVNLNIKGNGFFVTADVQVKVNVLVKLYDAYVRIGAGIGTVDDYVLIGAIGVTVDNLPYINADLKGKQYTVLVDVQARIDVVVKVYPSFLRINAGEGTIADYELIGAVGVTVDNLIYVNADLKGKNYLTVVDIKTRIEANINLYNALIRINKGIGTLDDYKVVGAVGVTIDNLIYVNNNIKGLGLGTYDEVKGKVKTIVAQYELDLKIAAILGRINDGTATVDDYAFIGVTGVTADNVIYINADLKGRGVKNHLDIQIRVNVIVDIYNSFIRVNNGTATVDDYTALGIVGVTIDNLIYVNADLKGKNYVTPREIQARINVNNNIFIALGRINAGQGTLDDYKLLGIVEVTIDNLVYVNAQLKGGNLLTLEDTKVNTIHIVNVYNALIRINLGEGTIEDYNLVGITGVTIENLVYVNAQLKGGNLLTVEGIKVKAGTVINVYDALVRINAGQGTVEDYALVGVEGVTLTNLVYVNAELKGKNYMTIEQIQREINVVITVRTSFEVINSGAGTLNDYITIGATNVTETNLVYVNAEVKGKGYNYVIDVQKSIDSVSAIVDVLIRVNNGEATLEDYAKIGVSGVLDTNLAYVNGQVKGKNYSTVVEIKVAVDAVPNKELKDVDGDDDFDIVDLGMAAREYGQDPTKITDNNPDVVIDGHVNDDDIKKIGELIP